MKQNAKSRSRKEILAGEHRCVYCDALPVEVEHMPPRAIFRKRERPSGLEFAVCKRCNSGTATADLAAAFFSRIDVAGDVLDWKIKEARGHLAMLAAMAPDFVQEFFAPGRNGERWHRSQGGVLQRRHEFTAGPIAQAYLKVFGAKLGMALFRRHVGQPLAMEGGVQVHWFLNAGLSVDSANEMLNILPVHDTLTQGRRKSASGQFDYRFNCDEKTIFAALVHFHTNLHFFVIAASDAALYGLPRKLPFSGFVKPGELVAHMPKRKPIIVLSR